MKNIRITVLALNIIIGFAYKIPGSNNSGTQKPNDLIAERILNTFPLIDG